MYYDESTLLNINRIRHDMKNFVDHFEAHRGLYCRPCEVMQSFKDILEKNYLLMKPRDIVPKEEFSTPRFKTFEIVM